MILVNPKLTTYNQHPSHRSNKLDFNQRWPTHNCVYLVKLVYPVFCSCDLDLDPMTLIYEYDLGILKMYLHTKNEVSELKAFIEKLEHQQDRHTHTDRQTNKRDRKHYYSRIGGW